MSKEKQIEELTNELIFTNNYGTHNAVAKYLYEKGYRKQSEVIRCKDCEHFYQVGDVMICRHWNYHSTKDDAYCSFAKMKGGAE